MSGEAIVMIVISCFVIWVAYKILESLFRMAIKAFKIIGAFAVALIPALIAVFLTSIFMDVTEAQAATQFVTTDVVMGVIGNSVFGK